MIIRSVSVVIYLCLFNVIPATAAERSNVVLIICDDLNDYIEGLDGHPQAQTPNIKRLCASGVSFTQAHCNIPICAPSRSSFLTGIYPHTSRNFGFDRWDENEVLQNSRTIMDHFRANGYHTLGTGKLMHHLKRQEWAEWGNPADYGPFAFDGTERIAHPDVPAPFRDIGTIDGSFGPLKNLAGRTFADDKSYSWQTGNWQGMRTLRVDSPSDRDMTADELNGQWAVGKLHELAEQSDHKPFFMGVGLIRPHTPLIVPQRFFDQFPLDSIELPVIRPGDVKDTYARSIRGIPAGKEPDSERTEDMGSRLFNSLVASYDSQDEALRHFIQAYLASVASVDELIGNILNAVDNSRLKDNTIVILTSDHGWGMGEKDYLYKNSLWQESTQVPLIVRAPGIAKEGAVADQPVSLIDLYPTLIDLCGLTGDTRKNDKGRPIEGHSLRPFLENPRTDQWSGPDEVLTALYKWARFYDPSEQSYSLRSKDWRYIRYSNGKEELYHNAVDSYEWDNLADDAGYASRLEAFRERLQARLPKPGAVPRQVNSVTPTTKVSSDSDAEAWKAKYFAKHPDADANKDGDTFAAELPRLPKDVDPQEQNYQAQAKLPYLPVAYVSTLPEDLRDGLQVGTLNAPGTREAIKALVTDDRAGRYSNLDSLLLWKDGKLLFEMYSRRGRVDAPHYTMSVTKTLTSVMLARALQLGLLSMADLDKPVVDFMPEIDRSQIQPGVDTITLRDALFMKSGLRFSERFIERKLGGEYSRQQYFQKLFELTSPVIPESKEYKYTGIDPSMIMMIIDIRCPDTVQEFIATELAGKIGATYCWENQECGIPKCGAGSNFTSRDLIKIGAMIIQEGEFGGEQLLSNEYVKLVMDTSKGEGYFYFFHNREKGAGNGTVNFISGIGAGGQYMATFPELNVVAVATAHNKKEIGKPLQAMMDHLIPLFKD